MKTNKVQFMTQAAMIAAIYVVLCVVFQPISYGPIQTRIAEALTVLPFFTPAAVPGLFVGCLIANALGGGIILDILAGSVATLIAAFATYALRNKSRYLASVPPVVGQRAHHSLGSEIRLRRAPSDSLYDGNRGSGRDSDRHDCGNYPSGSPGPLPDRYLQDSIS